MSLSDAFQFVLKHEGGYVNDPTDKGGSTNRGVTIQTLSHYRGTVATEDDVRQLSLNETLAIYTQFYWTPMRLEEIKNPKFQLALFDQAILCGSHIVVERLQNALGAKVDGVIGDHTIGAINLALDQDTLYRKFICLLQMRYVQICVQDPTQIKFLAGWLSRWQDLLFL